MSKPSINRLRHRDYCAAVRCYNSRARQRNLAFFTFPREPDRCLKWVENCRGEELPGKTAEALFRYYVLCADHFEDNQFQDAESKTVLIRSAIPTLLNVPDPPLTIAQEKARGCPFVTSSPEKNDGNKDVDKKSKPIKVGIPSSGNGTTSKSTSSLSVVKTAAASPSMSMAAQRLIKENPNGLMPGILTEQQLRYIETRKTLSKQRNQISKLQKQVRILKSKVKTRHTVDDIIENASRYMSGVPLDFFASQLRMASKKDNGRRWTEEDKFFALMLKCISLEAYRLCGKVFNLPCTRTLHRWLKDYKQEVPNFEARLRAYKQKLMLNAGEVTAAEKALKSVAAGSLDSLATGEVSLLAEGGQDFAACDQTLVLADEQSVVCVVEASLHAAAATPVTVECNFPFVQLPNAGMQTARSVLSAVAAPRKAAVKRPLAPRQKQATAERAPRKRRAKVADVSGQDQQSLELLASLSTIVEPQPSQEIHMEPLTLDPEAYQLLASAGHLEDGTTFALQEVNSAGAVILTPITNGSMPLMCNQ